MNPDAMGSIFHNATTSATVSHNATMPTALFSTLQNQTALQSLFTASLNMTTSNGTRRGPNQTMVFDPTYHYIWISVSLFVFTVNVFVLYVFKSDSKLLRGVPANNLLLSLAVNDLLTGLVSLMQVLPYMEYHIFRKSSIMTLGFRIGMDVSITMLSLTSVIHLCFLVGERYLAIFYALQFKGLVTTRRVRYSIMAAWAIACCIALLQFTWTWPLLRGHTSLPQQRKIQNIDIYFSAVITVAFALTPLILLVIAYAKMFVMCSKLIRQAPDNLLVRRKTLHKEIKILVMYFVMFFIFLLLCVPFFSIRLMVDICTMTKRRVTLQKELIEAFVLMRYLASAINPVIYTFYKQDFRRTIKGLCFFTRLRGVLSYSSRHSNLEDGNETVTREMFASIGIPMTLFKKSGSEDKSCESTSSRFLLPRNTSFQNGAIHRVSLSS